MTKSILLGAVDTLEWWQVKPWVMSAKEVGFDGEIWLIVYRETDEFKTQAEAAGVNLYCVEHNRYMAPIQHTIQNSPTVSHNMRFYHAWELLTRLNNDKEEYVEHPAYCAITDVRDVIFQNNPEIWWRNKGYEQYIIAASEGISYENEPWNRDNMIKGYGQNFYDLEAKYWDAYNIGTVSGNIYRMKEMCHTLYSMTEGRHYPSDQSSFALLAHSKAFDIVQFPMEAGYAAQCGTTLDPTKSFLWNKCHTQPVIKDGKVYTKNGELFCLVHQYDRVPELKKIIEEKYK